MNTSTGGAFLVDGTTGLPDYTTAAPPEGGDGNSEDYLYNVAEKIFLYVDPVLTFGGIIANMLMLAVMLRKSQRRSPVAVFMSALAIADSLVLILDFINNWLKYGPRIYLLGLSGFCEFHRYFFNVVYTYSSWLVMGLSVERFIVVWFPLKAREICTVKGSVITVVSMAVTLVVLYLYNLWGHYINPEGFCDTAPEMADFQNNVSPWLTAVLYSYLPLTLILFSNVAIIYKLAQAAKRRKKMVGEERDEAMHKVTFTVVVICVMFFVLTTPVTLFYVIVFALGEFIQPGPRTAVGETFILIFGLSNHAINFFLYIWTSESFRTDLRAMFGRTAVDRSHDYKASGNSTNRTKTTSAAPTGSVAKESSSAVVAEDDSKGENKA